MCREIETSKRRVLVEIAQYIGELQCPSQMMGKRNPLLLLHSEDAHRQSADRARDPIAVGVERGVVRRSDVLDHVHFHSIDDGMEVLAAQAEIAYWGDEPARARNRLARIERIDIGAPALKLLAPFMARAARIRDIVDLPAKGIDFKHRRALRARQYPHCIIERA